MIHESAAYKISFRVYELKRVYERVSESNKLSWRIYYSALIFYSLPIVTLSTPSCRRAGREKDIIGKGSVKHRIK